MVARASPPSSRVTGRHRRRNTAALSPLRQSPGRCRSQRRRQQTSGREQEARRAAKRDHDSARSSLMFARCGDIEPGRPAGFDPLSQATKRQGLTTAGHRSAHDPGPLKNRKRSPATLAVSAFSGDSRRCAEGAGREERLCTGATTQSDPTGGNRMAEKRMPVAERQREPRPGCQSCIGVRSTGVRRSGTYGGCGSGSSRHPKRGTLQGSAGCRS